MVLTIYSLPFVLFCQFKCNITGNGKNRYSKCKSNSKKKEKKMLLKSKSVHFIRRKSQFATSFLSFPHLCCEKAASAKVSCSESTALWELRVMTPVFRTDYFCKKVFSVCLSKIDRFLISPDDLGAFSSSTLPI